ncbi:uncharacterized protein LOC124172348 [Ischnura elegans]|uniref:uncharacterized protein LOC124172348 n=1 Tax=Ischnura elegans TaxID=197161 RepID=UPI001ED8A419|nr:uncharacterized protein LOC124172348 [Ischnura elegans]
MKKARRVSSSEDSSEDDPWQTQISCRRIENLPKPPSISSIDRGHKNRPTNQMASLSPVKMSPHSERERELLPCSPPKGPTASAASEIDFRRQVLRELAVLRATASRNSDAIQAILDAVCSTQSRSVDVSAAMPANLPLQSLEHLEKLEEDLADETVKRNMVICLSRIGGNNLADVTKRMLTRLMSDNLASQFSWVGAKKKKPLSSKLMADVILRAVQRNPLFKDASEKEIELAIKNWLRHAPERCNGKKKSDQENS